MYAALLPHVPSMGLEETLMYYYRHKLMTVIIYQCFYVFMTKKYISVYEGNNVSVFLRVL
jgi:hypothetical protein